MIDLSGLRASSATVASVEVVLSGSVSMMAVTRSARSSARSSNELSGALEVGLGGFDSLTVNN